MYDTLQFINKRPNPYEFDTDESFWTDKHISKKLLELHLAKNNDHASKNKNYIDESINWISSYFDIKEGTTICDFGCGPGLYTTPLAKLKADVTGIDFSKNSLQHAQGLADKHSLTIQYIKQNYLKFRTSKKFDLILMLYSDFCTLSPAQRKEILNIFLHCIAEDGEVLLEVLSHQAYKKKTEVSLYSHMLYDGFWSAENYYGFMKIFKYDEEKIILNKYAIIEKERTRYFYTWLQYYCLDSLRQEIENNGFYIKEHFSNTSGAPYHDSSDEIAIVIKKQ